MKLKIFLAPLIDKRLEHEARTRRRALRDHLRHEVSRIRQLEIHSRGLRSTRPGRRTGLQGSSTPTVRIGLKEGSRMQAHKLKPKLARSLNPPFTGYV
jgi:hypothetical protein